MGGRKVSHRRGFTQFAAHACRAAASRV